MALSSHTISVYFFIKGQNFYIGSDIFCLKEEYGQLRSTRPQVRIDSYALVQYVHITTKLYFNGQGHNNLVVYLGKGPTLLRICPAFVQKKAATLLPASCLAHWVSGLSINVMCSLKSTWQWFHQMALSMVSNASNQNMENTLNNQLFVMNNLKICSF